MEPIIYDEWNKPEWVQVEEKEYQKLQENIEYYKTAIKALKEELGIVEKIMEELEDAIN